ncbi:stress-activated protein kinase alpha-like [Schistocerca gregaria]|uniref:stress-activated protein kinase alpha-like n=1 Tax=Schistocerca gregaria TaxID=7010 RepID=UPI00211EC933|nr:stress-activated protein kinase alpha-like [Schistocerca gregaria]
MGEPVESRYAAACSPEGVPRRGGGDGARRKLALSYVEGLTELDPSSVANVDSNGMTLLHRACHEGHLDLVKCLIRFDRCRIDGALGAAEKGASILPTLNYQDIFGRTALTMAVSANHEAVVEELLAYYDYLKGRVTSVVGGGDKERRMGGLSAKERLARFPHLGINLKDARGQSALMIATRKGHTSILRRLLRAEGTDVNCCDDRMRSCLHFVCSQYFSSREACGGAVASASDRFGACDRRRGGSPSSVVRMAAEYAELLISFGIDLALRDICSNTVFHLCLRKGDTELLQSILDAAERHNSKSLLQALQTANRLGQTPLQLSSVACSSDAAGSLKRVYDVCVQKECRRLGVEKMDKRFISKHWLTMIGLPQYRDVFFKNDVSGLVLLRLTEEMLKKDLGVDSLGHRMTILQASRALASVSARPTSLEPSGAPPGATASEREKCGYEEFMREAYKWEILEEELDLRERIGRGFFGEVRRAVWRKLEVATKTIYRESAGAKDLSKKSLTYKEMSILSQLRHPNILNFLGFVRTSGGDIMMVTELMPNGSLHKLIRYDFGTVRRLRYRIVLDIARGMAYLHSRRLVHRDLNTKNLLLDANYATKISDFGLSRIRDEMNNMSVLVGFLGVMAPEVFKGEKYSEKADVFSFAMVLYEILTGREACQLEGASLPAYANSVANQGYRPPWTDRVLQDESLASWRRLTEECWAQDPENRLSFYQILERIPRLSLEQSAESHGAQSAADASDDVRYVV